VPSKGFYENFQMIIVSIQKVSDRFQLTTGDIKHYVSPNLESKDRSLQQFLEIAIAQPVLMNP
jgi:hypothetical protein